MEKLSDPLTAQDKELASQHAILSSMVLSKQEELRKIQQAVAVELTQLSRFKDEQQTAKTQADYQRKIDKEQHDAAIANDRLEARKHQQALEQAQRELDSRRKDIEQIEQEQAPLRALKASLTDEQARFESVRLQAMETADSAQRQLTEANARWDEVRAEEAQLKEQARVIQNKLIDLDARESTVAQQSAATHAELTRLTALQADLGPRLKEFEAGKVQANEESIRAASLLKEAQQKLAEVEQSKADLQGLLQRQQMREQVLSSWSQQLKQTAFELQTKAASLEAQGASGVPKVSTQEPLPVA